MLYREIMPVCSEIPTKHINTLCGQKVEFFMLNVVVYIVTTGLLKLKYSSLHYASSHKFPVIYQLAPLPPLFTAAPTKQTRRSIALSVSARSLV
jgi:hypothetical protein